MTHKTGSRPNAIASFTRCVREAIDASDPRPTYSEMLEVFHEETIRSLRSILGPREDETCPTCPKTVGGMEE